MKSEKPSLAELLNSQGLNRVRSRNADVDDVLVDVSLEREDDPTLDCSTFMKSGYVQRPTR